MKTLSSIVAVLICVGVAEANPERAGLVTSLEGEARLARAEQVEPLRYPSDVFFHDRIDTAERSLVRILLGGKALVTVRELSTLTIREDAERSSVELKSGAVGIEVAKKLLRPGGSVDVKTPNAIAAVRGSFVVVETLPTGEGSETQILTREVSKPVDVTCGKSTAALDDDQFVSCSGVGDRLSMSAPRSLTSEERAKVDAIQQSPRAREHDDDLSDALKQALAAQAAKETSPQHRGAGENGLSTADLGVHEVAALGLGSTPLEGAPPVDAPPTGGGIARRGPSAVVAPPVVPPAGENPPPAVIPPVVVPPAVVPPVVVPPGGGAPGPVVNVPGGGGGSPPGGGQPPGGNPPPVVPPPVVPPPVVPPPVVSAGPGFSHIPGGNSGGANASPTGRAPPAHGLGGNPPPGLSKKN